MEILNRDIIKTFLPHREPMLLIDDVAMEGNEAIAHYHVRGDEYFLQGHFPGNPIVPGVILCEIMGQSCCILVRDELAVGRTPLYSGIKEARFRQPVRPGDTIEIRGHITDRRNLIFHVEAEAKVNGKTAVKAVLSFALIDTPKGE
jgi:3-hydroxyacyl-[acyl-carrier-protein] dehydratase